jgi:hypothetical protein
MSEPWLLAVTLFGEPRWMNTRPDLWALLLLPVCVPAIAAVVAMMVQMIRDGHRRRTREA